MRERKKEEAKPSENWPATVTIAVHLKYEWA